MDKDVRDLKDKLQDLRGSSERLTQSMHAARAVTERLSLESSLLVQVSRDVIEESRRIVRRSQLTRSLLD